MQGTCLHSQLYWHLSPWHQASEFTCKILVFQNTLTWGLWPVTISWLIEGPHFPSLVVFDCMKFHGVVIFQGTTCFSLFFCLFPWNPKITSPLSFCFLYKTNSKELKPFPYKKIKHALEETWLHDVFGLIRVKVTFHGRDLEKLMAL